VAAARLQLVFFCGNEADKIKRSLKTIVVKARW